MRTCSARRLGDQAQLHETATVTQRGLPGSPDARKASGRMCSYRLGRAQAASDHTFEDAALIEMMQSQLQKASYTIDYLAESLDFSERRNYCNTCHVTLRPAENPHLSYLADRADEIELLKLMSKESIEELRLRHHGSRARHGV